MKEMDEKDRTIKQFLVKIIAALICIVLLSGYLNPQYALAGVSTSNEATSLLDLTKTESTNAETEQRGTLHAFYPANATFTEQIQTYIDQLDSISFAFAQIDADDPAYINTTKGKNGNYGFYYPSDYIMPISYAKEQGKSIQLNIYMSDSDSNLILSDQEKQKELLQAIIDILQTEIAQGSNLYYDGVVIDFEGLRNTDESGNSILYEGKPISDYFVQFLKELNQKLDSIQKKLYVAVNPLLYYDGYDYAQILTIADQVILMAHDYEPTKKLYKYQISQYTGYDALEPMDSLAPINKVRQSLNDMLEAAGDALMLSKVWLQISFDTAQWQFGAKSMSDWMTQSNMTLSKSNRITPLYTTLKDRVANVDKSGTDLSYGYNNELQSPYLQYINASNQTYNIILYEDSKSIKAKINLAKSYELGGISLWSLNNVPDYNDTLSKKYGLNGWDTILTAMEDFDSLPANASKYVSFSDKAVELAVREKLGKTTGKITAYELGSIYRLKLGKGVKSLVDLKKMKQLEYLDASSLGLTDITNLSSLTKLRVLYLQRNKISNITPLKGLTNLEVLSLNGNQITSVKSLAKLKSLQKLYLRENKLKSIYYLKWLGNLKELYVKGNSITTYSSMKKIYNTDGFVCDFVVK